jgi:hypothetical protein
MRRTLMMGMLAALLTSSAGLALASDRFDDRASGRNDDTQYQQQNGRQDSRFDRGQNGGPSWGHARGMRNDRGFDSRNDRRFKSECNRGGSGSGGSDRRGSGNGGHGNGGYGNGGYGNGGYGDGRNHGPSHDPRDARRPTPMPDRGW